MFLRNLDNASRFLRQAIDSHIAKCEKTEKTVVLLEGIKESEKKIKEQGEALTKAEEEYKEIEKQVEEWKDRLELTKKVADGQIHVKFHEGKMQYESFVEWKDKPVRIAYGTDENKVRGHTVNLGKENYDKVQAKLNKLEKQKQRQATLIEAYRQKLTFMQKELEKLEANV